VNGADPPNVDEGALDWVALLRSVRPCASLLSSCLAAHPRLICLDHL
jgi:hypothetical protein